MIKLDHLSIFVPTFFVGEQMFWGNDRIVILKHVLSKMREPEA